MSNLDMYHSLIKEIDNLQRQRLSIISLNEGKLSYSDGPNTRENGLYWIYTDYSDNDFSRSTPCSKSGSVNFSEMVAKNSRIKELCQEQVDAYRLVYNGIGGVGPKGGGGLRERILGEYRGGTGTGSLAIRDSSLSDLSRWRVSYVLWSEIDFFKDFEYKPFSNAIEGLWRLHYGWPILCTK